MANKNHPQVLSMLTTSLFLGPVDPTFSLVGLTDVVQLKQGQFSCSLSTGELSFSGILDF